MNKLLGFVARIAVGKHVVASLAWAHNALDGHRSQISLTGLLLVHGLKLAGIIPPETANTIEIALGAILPVTLADKASKVISLVDQVAPAVPVTEEPKP